MIDDDADDREREEAEALAEALEGRAPEGAPPEDALETAALLRYSGREGELSSERADAILDDLMRGAPTRSRQTRERPWFSRKLPWLVGLASASAVAAFLSWRPAADHPVASRGAPVPASTLPAPPAALVAAQADLAKGAAGRAHFDVAMRAYRDEVLRTLEARYPARLSALDDDARRAPR